MKTYCIKCERESAADVCRECKNKPVEAKPFRPWEPLPCVDDPRDDDRAAIRLERHNDSRPLRLLDVVRVIRPDLLNHPLHLGAWDLQAVVHPSSE